MTSRARRWVKVRSHQTCCVAVSCGVLRYAAKRRNMPHRNATQRIRWYERTLYRYFVRATNDVVTTKALSTLATMSKQRCRILYESNDSIDKVETNWTCSIRFESSKFHDKLELVRHWCWCVRRRQTVSLQQQWEHDAAAVDSLRLYIHAYSRPTWYSPKIDAYLVPFCACAAACWRPRNRIQMSQSMADVVTSCR